jgi:hypothetical protein
MINPSSVATTAVLAAILLGTIGISSAQDVLPRPEPPFETLDIGEDTGTPVSEDYHVPFKFNGALNKVVIDLGEAKLSPQEQKELDQQEGTNEVVD